jgi:hypothetical protein
LLREVLSGPRRGLLVIHLILKMNKVLRYNMLIFIIRAKFLTVQFGYVTDLYISFMKRFPKSVTSPLLLCSFVWHCCVSTKWTRVQ